MQKITKILKTLVPSHDGIFSYDTIEYEGKLWIVPEWLDNPSKGYSMPARIICLTFLPHTGRFSDADYTLRDPIPRSVFEGHVPLELRNLYVVIENPEIFVDIQA